MDDMMDPPVYWVNESMLWDDATPEDAQAVIDVLNDWGYVTQYGAAPLGIQSGDHIPTAEDWNDAVEIVTDLHLTGKAQEMNTEPKRNADMAKLMLTSGGRDGQAQTYALLAVADQLERIANVLEMNQWATLAKSALLATPQAQGAMPTDESGFSMIGQPLDDGSAEESEASWAHYQQVKQAHQEMIDRNRGQQ